MFLVFIKCNNTFHFYNMCVPILVVCILLSKNILVLVLCFCSLKKILILTF
jgi:hypothetical protein